MQIRGNTARMNVTVTAGSYHCLYGSWLEQLPDSQPQPQTMWNAASERSPAVGVGQFLHRLPKEVRVADDDRFQFFGQRQLWHVECHKPRYVITHTLRTHLS